MGQCTGMKRNIRHVNVVVIFCCHLVLWGCSQNINRKQVQVENMTDIQLLAAYHAIGDRIRDMEMRHRIDKQLNRFYFEHDMVLDLSIDGKIHKLEQKRKMILKELQRRHIEPGCN